MIGETAPAEQATTTRLSPGEAFVCLLTDGSVSPHEANRIADVVAAMKLFRGPDHETRNGLFSIVDVLTIRNAG